MNMFDNEIKLPVRVLLVEDELADAELIIDELRENGMECLDLRVDNEDDYLEALESFRPDIVLSDLSLPTFSGYRSVELLRQRDALLPLIFVSGTIGEAVAVEALQRGANDYILKNNTVRLTAAVRRALREAAEQRARQHAEEELIRTQRFESLALLASGLSHDLRNLLQPLLLVADTLDDYDGGDEHLTRLASLVRSCGQRGLDMVSSMLTFARGAQRSEKLHVDVLFHALSLLLKGSLPRTISLDIGEIVEELAIECNHTELQQCLLNLCLNAIQAMPDGGRLMVSGRREALNRDFFRDGEPASSGNFVCLCVTDTGVGMSPETQARLFQPFFTTKNNGTGLGLVSCRRIVDNLEGVIRITSAPGEGTCVSLYFPEKMRNLEDISTADMPRGHGERILVVQEETVQLSLLTSALEGAGYDVHASQSGTAALQSLEMDGLPQLAVMDADMNLLTGVRTLAALLERNYHGAVLLLAHPDAPPNLDDLPPVEHLDILDKPVRVGALLRAARAALDASRQHDDQHL